MLHVTELDITTMTVVLNVGHVKGVVKLLAAPLMSQDQSQTIKYPHSIKDHHD